MGGWRVWNAMVASVGGARSPGSQRAPPRGRGGRAPRWGEGEPLKALVWFWLIDETLSANLVYQDDYEIGSTTPSDEAMTKIMTMVIAW